MKKTMKTLTAAAVSIAAMVVSAFASETTGLQATTAVRNWVKRNAHPMATGLVDGEGVARTFRDDGGKALFHAVDLEGGGFVVVSGDTKESPIVAFSDSGAFEATMKNPLYALLVQHMTASANAIAAEATNTAKRTHGRLSASPSAPLSASEGEWAELLDDSSTVTVGGRSSRPTLKSTADTSDSMITDMRVPPLCPTQWSQQGWNASGYAFNYYTPGNYPCGCTATAMAQIMYRWKMPTAYVTPRSYQCSVDGVAETLTTRGGNYAWGTMPVSMVTQYSATLSERQAVGHLLYDVGVSIKSGYTSGGTGSYGFYIPVALQENFGYAEGKSYLLNVTYGYDASYWSVLENGVYASLDAGMPVALSIHEPLSGTKSGHCVVLDGYGYIDSTRWTHLNSGWAGKSDAWYRFFGETLTSMDYTYLQEFAYNMHPTTKGDVISGRVTDHTGAPVAGATVTRTLSGAKEYATTDERGIYFFRVTSGGTYSLSAAKGGLTSPVRETSVSIGSTCAFSSTFDGSGWRVYISSRGSVGNRWGQDLQLAAPALESLTLSGPSSVNCGSSASYTATAHYTDGSSKIVTTSSTWSLTSGSSYGSIGSSTGVLSTYETYETGRSVTIRAVFGTLSATKVVTIVPMKRERVFNSISLTGPDSVEGGSTASYTAVAGFDDGSTSNITLVAEWSLSSGSSYGDISSSGVLSAYETTEHGRTVTVRVSWTYNGVTLSAQKTVEILFSYRLKRPVSLTINGASKLAVGMTTPYTAVVTYNDGTTVEKTLDAVWSVTPGGLAAKVEKGSSSVALTAYSDDSGSLTLTAAYSEKVASISGLVACYNLNGNTRDSSGCGNHGTARGAVPVEGRNGKANNAYWFDGNDWIQVANSPSLRAINNKISISTWIKPVAWATNGSGSWVPVVCKGWDERQYGLQVKNDGRYDFKDEYGVFVAAGVENSLKLGEWQHIAMTYDGSVMRAYLNGRLVGENTISRSFTANDADLYIGYDRPGSEEYLTGAIDDVRIFNRALSVEEIASVSTEDGETVTVKGTKIVTIIPTITIPEAVDVKKDGAVIYPFEFTTGATTGGNHWYGQSGKFYYDGDAAQSGFMRGSYGQSWLETTVSGAGTFSFWWNVSSEPIYDHLKFEVDGIQYGHSISGTTNDWQKVVVPLGAGDHVLRWTYAKDEMNDYGEDAGWVDKIEWTPLAPPAAPVVTATDGASTDNVVVEWTEPASSRPVSVYEVSRSADGGSTWVVLAASVTGTRWVDDTIEPGVDRTYRVRAANDAGWGAYGSDTGWRRIALAVTPTEVSAPYIGGPFAFAVTGSVAWTASTEAWGTLSPASGPAIGSLTLTLGNNADLAARIGTMTVTAGAELDHPETATVVISQAGRPAHSNIGFCQPYEDWRIPLQIGDAEAEEGFYAPVSVFGTDEDLCISFGWTNRGESVVSLPSVKFTVLNTESKTILEWTGDARPEEELSSGDGTHSWGWPCDPVQVLAPGDYMLVAELDPENTLDETVLERKDNTEIFRFAVADRSLGAGDVFTTDFWTNIEFKVGNDFAQAPHVAVRSVPSGETFATSAAAQFGPYTPMNGLVGRTSGKAPLDLVFLIDVTGSMWGCIDGLKANIREFFAALIAGDADNPPITDWRAKVIGYRDVTCDRSWYEDHGFTTDIGEFNSHIASCVASGGGDGPESLLDAVWRIAKETDFREGASRAIVAFTDARYKTPMSYGGAAGGGVDVAVAAAKEAGINLQLIASTSNDDLRKFAVAVSEHSSYKYVAGLSSTTLDGEMLRSLAKDVSSGVKEAEIVEPMLSANVRGRGTLTFDWKNDSTAGTNNTFTFMCDAVTNIANDAGTGWKHVRLELDEGWHYFQWSYGKLFYEGDVTDCGVLANVEWEPYATALEIAPPEARLDHLGTNTLDGVYGASFEVTCNSVWKTVEHDDWITIVRGDGDGDGELVINVDTNLAYASRTGYITVRAGEYGRSSDLILERTVKVVQEAAPYREDGTVHILDVGLKPRWPWNGIVDVDFRVAAPAKGIPTTIEIAGYDGQGADFAFTSAQNWRSFDPRSQYFVTDGDSPVQRARLLTTGTAKPKFECTTSGVYRISWNLGLDWWRSGNKMWRAANSFHSPDFSVTLTASATNSAGVAHSDMRSSSAVRVDTRQVTYLGGRLASGVELVGHEGGLVDPLPWNTCTTNDGLASAALVFDEADRNAVMTNTPVCVVNKAYVRGGTLTTNETWGADCVHIIRDHVFVPAGVVLTIEDGAVLKFCGETKLFCTANSDIRTGWNINLKGVYCVYVDNDSVGGDTLSGGSSAIGSSSTITSRTFFYDNKFSGSTDSQIPLSGSSKGLFEVAMSVVDTAQVTPQNLHPYRIAWYRYYTRNQPYGKLPRPVAEPGEQFYGWILRGNNPWTDLKKYTPGSSEYISTYVGMRSSIVASTQLVFKAESSGDLGKTGERQLWAYSDTSDNQPDNFSEKIDGSAAHVTVTPAVELYNGSVHSPEVQVKIDEATVPSANYTVSWDGDLKSAGTHTATINFRWDYTGSPSATFEILPCDASEAVVTLSPETTKYSGSVQKPSVSVSLGGKSVLPSDYAVDWGDGDWTRVGTYTVKVVFKGDYTGEVPATFTITENDALKVVFWRSRAEALERVNDPANTRADGSKKRILFISGRDDDIPTQYVKDCLENVPRIRDFVKANFVCWYDDCDSETTEYPTYVRGLKSVALPLVGVISVNDMSKCVVRSAGYMSEDDVYKFVTDAAAASEDASSATVTLSATSFTYDGTQKTPSVTSVSYMGKSIPAANYTVEYSSETRTAVGRYSAWVVFDPKVPFEGYSLAGKTASVRFQIVPKEFTASDVKLSPASATYNGSMQKPTVSVPSDPSATFDVDYGVGNYTDAGNYTVRVTFTGGAVGEVEKTFTIARAGASSAVVSLEWYSDKADGNVKQPAVTSVVLGDYTFGVDEYDVSYSGEGRVAGTYSATVTFKGNWTGSASASFRLESDVLPDPKDVKPEDIDDRLDELDLPNDDDLAKLKEWIGTDLEEYASFRDWIADVGIEAARKSSRVYESFRLSKILAAPQILGEADEIKIEISEFSIGDGGSSAWDLTVRIVCDAGEDTVEFVLSVVESAKAAFAEMVRRASSLEDLDDGLIDASEVEATLMPGGKAVILSVEPPSGGKSGFMTIKFE